MRPQQSRTFLKRYDLTGLVECSSPDRLEELVSHARIQVDFCWIMGYGYLDA
jgi:hypothetical protein